MWLLLIGSDDTTGFVRHGVPSQNGTSDVKLWITRDTPYPRWTAEALSCCSGRRDREQRPSRRARRPSAQRQPVAEIVGKEYGSGSRCSHPRVPISRTRSRAARLSGATSRSRTTSSAARRRDAGRARSDTIALSIAAQLARKSVSSTSGRSTRGWRVDQASARRPIPDAPNNSEQAYDDRRVYIGRTSRRRDPVFDAAGRNEMLAKPIPQAVAHLTTTPHDYQRRSPPPAREKTVPMPRAAQAKRSQGERVSHAAHGA